MKKVTKKSRRFANLNFSLYVQTHYPSNEKFGFTPNRHSPPHDPRRYQSPKKAEPYCAEKIKIKAISGRTNYPKHSKDNGFKKI
jgi:hypothetical protein